MSDIILLSLAVCFDSFSAAFACSSRRIKIPFRSALVISFIGSLMLGAGLALCKLIGGWLGDKINIVSGLLLLALGVASFFNDYIKGWIDRCTKAGDKLLSKDCIKRAFVLEVYLDKTKADRDNSRHLSPYEALVPALTLSADSLGVGISAGLAMGGGSKAASVLLTLFLGAVAVILGNCLGNKILSRLPLDLSFLSGLTLITLALIRLL